MRTRLSQRQADCLEGVAAYKTSKQIALDLGISPKTVDGYIAEAVAAFGARSRQEAATLYAAERALETGPGDLPGEPLRVEEPAQVQAPPVRQSDERRTATRDLGRLTPLLRLAIIALTALALTLGLGLAAMTVVGGIAIYDPDRSAQQRTDR